MAEYFTANAETGDVSEWDGVFGDITPTVSSTSPITGTWSFISTFNGTARTTIAYWIDSANRDAYYVRWYMRLNPSPWDIAYESFTRPLMIKNQAYTVSAAWVLFHDTGVGGVLGWSVHGQIDGNADYTFASSSTGITAGTAQCFELHYVRHATTGGIEFWIDGNLVAQVLNQNTAAFYAGMIYMGNYTPADGDVPTDGNVLRWDDVVVADAYVGPIGGPPTYTVTYDGNGATGGDVPVDSNEYEEDDPVTVAANTGLLVRTGYTIGDWNTAANGTGDSYDMTGTDEMIMPAENVTLYAQWELANTLYVRSGAEGTDDGSDWTNAFPDLPTTFVRGYTYYVAGGTYGGHNCDTAVDGTLVITIRGATIADHGTDTGWDDAYSVTTTPASFTSFIRFGLTATGYWVFDGAVGSGNVPSSYGFRFLNAEAAVSFGGNEGVTISNIDIKHVYAQAFATDAEKEFAYTSTQINHIANITISYCLSDGFQCAIIANGAAAATGIVIERNYFLNGFTSEAHHGEQINADGADFDGLICRYNTFDTCAGTAVVCANNSHITNSFVYGNLFVDCVTGNGIVAGTSAGGINGTVVYHNTFVRCTGAGWFVSGTGGGTNTTYNNLCYDMNGAGGGETTDYNCYIDTTNTPSETHGQTDMSGDPFVGGGDYHLTVGTNPGLDLGSPYDEDMDGTTRTNWTRGAYEYGTATYSVFYNANSGTGTVVDALSPYEETDTVTVLHPTDDGDITRIGYTFDHWDTQADDGGTNYAPDATFEMPAELVTLYAIWTAIDYTLTYDGNGADSGDPPVDGSSPYNYLDPVTTLPNSGALVKAGFVFNGWCTTADGTGTKRGVGSVWAMGAGNVTLFARWTIAIYSNVAARLAVFFGCLELLFGASTAGLLVVNQRQRAAMIKTRVEEILDRDLAAARAEVDYMLTHPTDRPEDTYGDHDT